ncbi:hypothetical protein SUGI_0315540 [Cryptomeria japonica]|uniref:ferredoxin-thioredoxin reductase, variable chain n=1 Tax=Cryptomeria japonica TaxID=3369 RepID=UPI002408968D|nr:ferredoxin-thioredoxin reductase, variable chain [Cryptomeria japonica]GLJ17958.1 hypothetical protein SUGI_0315540 [Cryptomeria japonica]
MALICAPNPLILKSNKPQVARFGAQIRHVPTCIPYPCHRSLQNKLPTERIRRNRIVCEIALEETVASVEDLELKAKVGDRVKVRGPLKVYHIPKTPEFDIGGMEGEVKDYVGVWKGKHISANLPYKVQFTMEVDGRSVKFFTHLKEDEFDVVT